MKGVCYDKADRRKEYRGDKKGDRKTRMDCDKELYERQIKIVDAQIDELVYDLYGLTEEEEKVEAR